MASQGGGGVPAPGLAGAFITPQAGLAIKDFFDPTRYHGRMAGLDPLGPRRPMTDLTMENIRRFFDPATYRQTLSSPQKRPSTPPATHPAAKQLKMGAAELVEKFKMAASLNGLTWAEMVAPRRKNFNTSSQINIIPIYVIVKSMSSHNISCVPCSCWHLGYEKTHHWCISLRGKFPLSRVVRVHLHHQHRLQIQNWLRWNKNLRRSSTVPMPPQRLLQLSMSQHPVLSALCLATWLLGWRQAPCYQVRFVILTLKTMYVP